MITINCPECKSALRRTEKSIGKKSKCKECGAQFVVPDNQAAEAANEHDEFDYASTIARFTGNYSDLVNQSNDQFDDMRTIARTAAKDVKAGDPASRDSANVQCANLKIGSMISERYLITGRLGAGGMGTVYRAVDSLTEVEYAVKVIPDALRNDKGAVKQLQREFAIAQQLTHPQLLRLNHFDSTADHIYVLMEFIDGENLEEFQVRKGGKLSDSEVKQFVTDLTAPLDFLHSKGIVHLDLKPQNLMYARTNTGKELKIADFGISQSLKEQIGRANANIDLQGTLCYMSPEQLRRQVCDRRSDVYSVGIILYHLLTGEFPFALTTPEDIIAWHIGPEAKLSELERPWRDVIEKCLKRSAEERYSSCQEIKQRLSEPTRAGTELTAKSTTGDPLDQAVEAVFSDIHITVADKSQPVPLIWATEQEAVDYVMNTMDTENRLCLPLISLSRAEGDGGPKDTDEIGYTLFAWAMAQHPDDISQIRSQIQATHLRSLASNADHDLELAIVSIANNEEYGDAILKYLYNLTVRRVSESVQSLDTVPIEDRMTDPSRYDGQSIRISGGTVTINAPMVGTFYARSNPESEAYVKVGDRVWEDTVVGIIEADMVFNEIPAECSGTVVEILVNDQDPVDFGKRMFRIDPSGTVMINAPMVGTFYSRPNLESEAYVKVGDRVWEDTVVGIIEADMVFNEIPAECSGTVVEILVNDQDPVDFDKPMFRIDPS